MNKYQNILDVIGQQRILPLFYHDDSATCLGVVKALYDAGIRTVEFTNRGSAALANLQLIVEERSNMPGLQVGVGTILSSGEAEQFIRAGADFMVSPVFDQEIADIAKRENILYIPGCMTPTEIHVAQKAGCTLIKLFPGNVVGPGFLSSIRPLFPNLLCMPTGGVTMKEENLQEWFNAGVYAVGMGSHLITEEILAKKDFNELSKQAKKVLKLTRKT